MKSKGTIGERVSYTVDQGRVEMKITGKIKKWQETLLLTWLVAWTLCGFYILMYLFGDWTLDQKFFLVAYLVFWAYFEYKAAHAWLWRRFGFEQIIVSEGNLTIKNNILGRGKLNKYFTQNIKEFGWISLEEGSFNSVYFKSFWLVGGESIGFKYMGQKIGLGRQLPKSDAAKAIGILKKYFKKK